MTKKDLETQNYMEENNETKKATEGLKNKIILNLLKKLGYEGEDAKTNFIKDRNNEHPNDVISGNNNKGLLKKVMKAFFSKNKMHFDQGNSHKETSSTPDQEKQFEATEKKKAPETVESITQSRKEELEDILGDLTEEEKRNLTHLEEMVRNHKEFEITEETKEKVSTPAKAKEYFNDFLDKLKQHLEDRNNQSLEFGKDYLLSPETLLNNIVIPTLKMYEGLPDEIKNDFNIQRIIQEIKKDTLPYVEPSLS